MGVGKSQGRKESRARQCREKALHGFRELYFRKNFMVMVGWVGPGVATAGKKGIGGVY